MKVVLQRVSSASVSVDGKIVGKIGNGLLLLIGVAQNDEKEDVDFVSAKCADLRIFSDEHGKMNLSVQDVEGSVLAVSQFTLLGNTRKGRRPSFIDAADPDKGEALYEYFIKCLRNKGLTVETGVFGAMMDVALVNDGPVTLIVESR